MKCTISLITVLICCLINNVFAQQRMLCFDLRTGTVDTLPMVEYDSTITKGNTAYSPGILDSNYCQLPQTLPTENLVTNAIFTKRRAASEDFNLQHFPVRATIELTGYENEELFSMATGSVISRKHVLTAAHCVTFDEKWENDSIIFRNDSLYVCPANDNSVVNNSFSCSWVSKVYVPENLSLYYSDFAVLELEHNIGDNTGWIGIGYNNNDSLLLQNTYFRFAYPGRHPSYRYCSENDTLFYQYGLAGDVNKDEIILKKMSSISGESGSSLMQVFYSHSYINYGITSYTLNRYTYCQRITAWKYYSILPIIENDLYFPPRPEPDENIFTVYPNPVNDVIYLNGSIFHTIQRASLYNATTSQVIFDVTYLKNNAEIDVSDLNSGYYILKIQTAEKTELHKIIKYGN